MLKILHAQRNMDMKRPAKPDYSIAHCYMVTLMTLSAKLQMPVITMLISWQIPLWDQKSGDEVKRLGFFRVAQVAISGAGFLPVFWKYGHILKVCSYLTWGDGKQCRIPGLKSAAENFWDSRTWLLLWPRDLLHSTVHIRVFYRLRAHCPGLTLFIQKCCSIRLHMYPMDILPWFLILAFPILWKAGCMRYESAPRPIDGSRHLLAGGRVLRQIWRSHEMLGVDTFRQRARLSLAVHAQPAVLPAEVVVMLVFPQLFFP